MSWVYNPQFGLYYNSQAGVWAKPDSATGRWTYADQMGREVDPARFEGPRAEPPSAAPPRPEQPKAPAAAPNRSHEEDGYQPLKRPPNFSDRQPPARDDPPPRERSPPSRPSVDRHPDEPAEDGELRRRYSSPPRGPTSRFDYRASAALRLVLLPESRSTSFPEPQNLAILPADPSAQVTIGRDKVEWGKRIRVKEMEVSKIHATLYWQPGERDRGPGTWWIVDNGSMYGTYVFFNRPRQPGDREEEDKKAEPERLSEPKKASQPRRIRHLDVIYIASTSRPLAAFEVHLHREWPISCPDCALRADEANRIPIDEAATAVSAPPASTAPVMTAASASAAPSLIPQEGDEEGKDKEKGGKYSMSSADVKKERERKRKAEMATLRGQFFGDEPTGSDGSWAKMRKKQKKGVPASATLVPLGAPEGSSTSTQYVDRAKARRVAMGSSAEDLPPSAYYGPDGRGVRNPEKARASAPAPAPPAPAPAPVEQNPFEATSKGAAMLAKLSGTPVGEGSPGAGLGSLVEARSMHTFASDRAGLGSREMMVGVEEVAKRSGGGDWRENVREQSRKRFSQM